MKETYKQQVLARLQALTGSSDDRVIDVALQDAQTWAVTYQHGPSGETRTGMVRKRDVRRHEKQRVFSLLSQVAFPGTAPAVPEPDLPNALIRDIRHLVRASVADLADSPVKILASFVDTLVLNVYQTDTSYQQIKGKLDRELQEELAALKERAQLEEEDIPTRFSFCDVPLTMTSKGEKGFQWILKSSKLSLAVNRGSKMALLAQIRLSSEYLWSVRDLGRVVSDVHVFLGSIFGPYIILQPSSCDLAVDVVGLDLSSVTHVKRSFVTRAQLSAQNPLSEQAVLAGPESIKSRWDRLTGLPFGARAGAVSGIIYDKLHEITYKSPEKGWFTDIWRVAKDEQGVPLWDGVSPVHRIEMRFKRPALNEAKQEGVFHGIESAYDLEERLPALWSYAVGHVGGGPDGLPDGWLRYVVPTEDTNRSRWPVHPDWTVIQSAFRPELIEAPVDEQEDLLTEVDAELSARPWKEASSPTSRKKARRPRLVPLSTPVVVPAPRELDLPPLIRERKYTVNLPRLVKQIGGCAITVEAWRPDRPIVPGGIEPDVSETVHFLYPLIEQYIAEKGKSFADLVRKKRDRYSIEVLAA